MFLDINPVIFKIGFIQVTYYYLVYLAGFIVCTLVLLKASKTKKINLSSSQVYDFMILSILGMLIGARIFHILFWDYAYFSTHLNEVWQIWNGGLSFHGGLLGILLVSFFYCKKNKIDLLKLADILIIPITFFLVLARLANFINQEIVGTITSVSWCFTFQGYEGCRHPVQLYAAAGKLLLFFILLGIKNKLKEFKSGFIFWAFLSLISLGRFFLDFIREDMHYLYLSAGQWFSLVILIVSTFTLVKHYKKDLSNLLN